MDTTTVIIFGSFCTIALCLFILLAVSWSRRKMRRYPRYQSPEIAAYDPGNSPRFEDGYVGFIADPIDSANVYGDPHIIVMDSVPDNDFILTPAVEAYSPEEDTVTLVDDLNVDDGVYLGGNDVIETSHYDTPSYDSSSYDSGSDYSGDSGGGDCGGCDGGGD